MTTAKTRKPSVTSADLRKSEARTEALLERRLTAIETRVAQMADIAQRAAARVSWILESVQLYRQTPGLDLSTIELKTLLVRMANDITGCETAIKGLQAICGKDGKARQKAPRRHRRMRA